MNQRYDIKQVGFGDPVNSLDFVRFTVELEGDQDVYADWQMELLTNTRQIAGTSDADTQIMGFTPARITLPIFFASREQFQRFRAKWGTVATLVLLARFTSHEGPRMHEHGTDYEYFASTLLLGITDVYHRIGGGVECRATFQRANTGMGVVT